jgi:hypothetical protein
MKSRSFALFAERAKLPAAWLIHATDEQGRDSFPVTEPRLCPAIVEEPERPVDYDCDEAVECVVIDLC